MLSENIYGYRSLDRSTHLLFMLMRCNNAAQQPHPKMFFVLYVPLRQ